MAVQEDVENGTVARDRRQIVEMFSGKTIYDTSASGSGSKIHMSMGDSALPLNYKNSPGQAGFKAATKLIEDGSEFVRTPFKWIKDIQANWHIYIVCATIICLCILCLYCAVRIYFVRKCNSNPVVASKFVDFATLIAHSHANRSAKPVPSISTMELHKNGEY